MHGRSFLMVIADAGRYWKIGWACTTIETEHHYCVVRVEDRTLGRRRRSLGETGGIALVRGRCKGLLARGNASGVGNLNVDIVRAADSSTKVAMAMLIIVILSVWLSERVGGRV